MIHSKVILIKMKFNTIEIKEIDPNLIEIEEIKIDLKINN
jgi:hypothetical protein